MMILRLAGGAETLARSVPRLCSVGVVFINVVREAARAHTAALRIMWRTLLLVGLTLAFAASAPPAPVVVLSMQNLPGSGEYPSPQYHHNVSAMTLKMWIDIRYGQILFCHASYYS